jgi:hypothetical protein
MQSEAEPTWAVTAWLLKLLLLPAEDAFVYSGAPAMSAPPSGPWQASQVVMAASFQVGFLYAGVPWPELWQ